jgi:hypothetical protein
MHHAGRVATKGDVMSATRARDQLAGLGVELP